MRGPEHAVEIIKARGMLTNPSEADIELALRRLERARNWIEEQAPEYLRFKIAETLPVETKRALSAGQKQGLEMLAADLAARDFTPVDLHNHVYEIAGKVGIKPSEMFEAIYLVLIGRKSGPRVGNFISALDKEFVVKRFKEIVQ